MPLHPTVAAVTDRIRQRSAPTRAAYLARLEQMGNSGPVRKSLSCTNLAHAFAAFEPNDKQVLREARWPNIAIVSSYNDLLSAHQPLERFPALIKQAVREAGAVAQFAGGVPALCDGVTQGQPGMELSLFSRDVIAMATAVALAHDAFDAVLCLDYSMPGCCTVTCRPSPVKVWRATARSHAWKTARWPGGRRRSEAATRACCVRPRGRSVPMVD